MYFVTVSDLITRLFYVESLNYYVVLLCYLHCLVVTGDAAGGLRESGEAFVSGS